MTPELEQIEQKINLTYRQMKKIEQMLENRRLLLKHLQAKKEAILTKEKAWLHPTLTELIEDLEMLG